MLGGDVSGPALVENRPAVSPMFNRITMESSNPSCAHCEKNGKQVLKHKSMHVHGGTIHRGSKVESTQTFIDR